MERLGANLATTRSSTVGFVLLSSRSNPIPSTRIACLNLFPSLPHAGYIPEILWDPDQPAETPTLPSVDEILGKEKPDIVVLQKIRGPSVVRLVRALRSRGISTVWCVCDVVDNEMVAETNATIAVTRFLRSLYDPALQSKIEVVHDGIENQTLTSGVALRPRRPRALLISSQELQSIPQINTAPTGWSVEIVGRFETSRLGRLRHLSWALQGAKTKMKMLQAACDPRVVRTTWSPSTVACALQRAQIGIVPIDTADYSVAKGSNEPAWRVKSENRLTLLMSAGLPVIATPIPAYEEVIVQGKNGFLATSHADWKRFFRLLQDAEIRTGMGKEARASVAERFSTSAQADAFIKVLLNLKCGLPRKH